MNSTFFSFLLCAVYCVGFVCGSPVETKNETDATKIVLPTIPNERVKQLVPSTKEADLNPQNKTIDAKNGTVISDKTAESHTTEPVPTVIPTHNATAANTTNNNTTSNSTTNANTNKTQDDKNSTNSTSPTPAVTPTKAAPPSEITTVKPSTTTHTVTILPTSKIEEKEKDRGFDGPSFIGGIVLALGLTGIGFVAYKFCKARTDRNYRNFAATLVLLFTLWLLVRDT